MNRQNRVISTKTGTIQKKIPQTSKHRLFGSLLAVGVSIAAAAVFLAFQSEEPAETLYAFFILPFSNSFYCGNMLDSAGLILLCALGFLLPARLRFFNLGGEGQAFAAALFAGQFALFADTLPQPFGIITGCFMGCVIAGMLGLFSYCLKYFLQINELISTYLAACGIIPLIDYAISEVFRDPSGNLIATPAIAESWQLRYVLHPSSLNTSIYIAAGAAAAIFFILKYTRLGYEAAVTAGNTALATTHRIPASAITVWAISAGAGLHGLAGALSVYGSHHSVYQGITSGLGWSGMAAALIGRQNPAGAVFGALFFAWIEAGGTAAMIDSAFSFELSAIVQGIAFLLITVEIVQHKKQTAQTALMPHSEEIAYV
ncbi:MAG: ABC transporter permease [Treponema sp.]